MYSYRRPKPTGRILYKLCSNGHELSPSNCYFTITKDYRAQKSCKVCGVKNTRNRRKLHRKIVLDTDIE